MAALRVIEASEGGNGAPTKCEVKDVPVFVCTDLWTKVHGCTRENTLDKISFLSSVAK